MTEIVKASSNGIQQHGTPLDFTPEQRKLILDSFLNGASEAEAAVLMELAKLRRLNPITRQIHFVKRWDGEKQREVWSAQVGIDGFRSIAERTGVYDGQDEPIFEYDAQGNLKSCKVAVYRKDVSRPFVGVAHFGEYCQKKKDGRLTRMWAEKPHIMISKCAEALAFRKGFPEDTSGLYTPEEMPPPERDVTPQGYNAPPSQRMTATTALKAKLAKSLPVESFTVEPAEKEPAARPSPPRKMPRIIDECEPPPPSDEDSPGYHAETGEVDDEPEEQVVMSFGSGKGKPLAELAAKDLNWYAKALAENVADEAKARWRDDNERKLNAIRREQQRRA
jgi:phage recombination protein Bet